MACCRHAGVIALVVIGVLLLLPVLGGIGMMGGWGMMGPGMMGGGWSGAPWADGRWAGGWGMPFLGMLFWLLILVGIVLVITSFVRRGGMGAQAGQDEAPIEILKRRLARGEVTREEYDAIKRELS
ncbi:MAG: SHOCT domain-containing protein [bacterium]|nr:SHOCT domain-containing protein [bacterium]